MLRFYLARLPDFLRLLAGSLDTWKGRTELLLLIGAVGATLAPTFVQALPTWAAFLPLPLLILHRMLFGYMRQIVTLEGRIEKLQGRLHPVLQLTVDAAGRATQGRWQSWESDEFDSETNEMYSRTRYDNHSYDTQSALVENRSGNPIAGIEIWISRLVIDDRLATVGPMKLATGLTLHPRQYQFVSFVRFGGEDRALHLMADGDIEARYLTDAGATLTLQATADGIPPTELVVRVDAETGRLRTVVNEA